MKTTAELGVWVPACTNPNTNDVTVWTDAVTGLVRIDMARNAAVIQPRIRCTPIVSAVNVMVCMSQSLNDAYAVMTFPETYLKRLDGDTSGMLRRSRVKKNEEAALTCPVPRSTMRMMKAATSGASTRTLS